MKPIKKVDVSQFWASPTARAEELLEAVVETCKEFPLYKAILAGHRRTLPLLSLHHDFEKSPLLEANPHRRGVSFVNRSGYELAYLGRFRVPKLMLEAYEVDGYVENRLMILDPISHKCRSVLEIRL